MSPTLLIGLFVTIAVASLPFLIAYVVARRIGHQAELYVLEAITFWIAWISTQVIANTAPPIEFMSRYTEAQRYVYLVSMTFLLAFLFIYQLLSYRFYGGTLARRLAGRRLVRADWAKLTFVDALRRTSIVTALWLLIVAPGPIIGFAFGDGSEPASIFALLLALLLCVFLATTKHSETNVYEQSYLDYLLRMKSVPAPRLFSTGSGSEA